LLVKSNQYNTIIHGIYKNILSKRYILVHDKCNITN
jgi:hypothetical protein